MAERRNLARHLRQCCDQGFAPRTDAADAKHWFLALEELIAIGALSEADYAARHLAASFPNSLYIARLTMLLDRMPPAVADPHFAGFINRSSQEVQIVRRDDATVALLAFCGRNGALGFPIPIAHRWFGQLGVHVVYLRDPFGYAYSAGLPALGLNRADAIRALRTIVADLGASRTVCFGNSNGGYAALLYGLEMEVEAVLAVNAITIYPADRIQPRIGLQARGYDPDLPDVPHLYATAPVRPRVHLVHGAGNADDAASAASMAGIPGVTINAVPDFDGHDAHIALIERGHYGALLEGLVVGWPEPGELAGGL